jgi:23S rRNA (pseudouridine1915-N3)-methyltransferase
MRIFLLFPGKIRPPVLAPAEAEYIRRLKRMGIETLEYKEERIQQRHPEQTRQREAKRILNLIKPTDWVVACDERGQAVTTRQMADLLQSARSGPPPVIARKRMVCVIGGAFGLDESVRKRADSVWSLSSLVMAGGVARLVLLEGIYRAMTLLEGHPYHNE